ncbi:MAG: carboxypeptidase-like regulatory domain-containing protein [Bacteroidales bacterium]
MSGTNKYTRADRFLRYLRREDSREERHELEQRLQADPFKQEAMEGFENLTPGQLEEDLLELHGRLRKKPGRGRRTTYFRLAAAVASLLIIGTVFVRIVDVDPLKKKETMAEEDLPATVTEPAPAPTAAPELRDEAAPAPASSEAEAVAGPDKNPVSTSKGNERTGTQPRTRNPSSWSFRWRRKSKRWKLPALPDRTKGRRVRAETQTVQVPAETGAQPGIRPETQGREAFPPYWRPPPPCPSSIRPSARPGRKAWNPSRTNLRRGTLGRDLQPLPGANVVVTGTTTGTVTDVDGRFTLPAEGTTKKRVVASFVGMETREFEVEESRPNELVLEPNETNLDEIVVVGYGTQSRTDPTGAVQTLDLAEDGSGRLYTRAQPEGGFRAFSDYVEENLVPPVADSLAVRGVVVLKFTVRPDGTINGLEVLRSPGPAHSQEAIRLLEEGPAWTPASYDDSGSVEDQVRLRIVFK